MFQALRLVVVLCVAFAAIPARAAELRLGVVDVQRCIMETTEGRRAKKDLEATFSKGQARLEKKAKALEKRVRDLQAKATMLAEGELRKRQESLVRSQEELQQLGAQLQEEVSQKETQLTGKIYNRVSGIVKQVALEENLEIVLVRSQMTMLYTNPKLDLTNRVIVRYDKNNK